MVAGKELHVVLYGGIRKSSTDVSFKDKNKSTLVMLPALGVPSPHLYYKPLAKALENDFNIVIVEPLGYGLSDIASTSRNVENINYELNEVLRILDIKESILLVHSISGVYGLNFVNNYPERVKGFIAIDNTIYDSAMQDEMKMEQDYMLKEVRKFRKLRNSFPSIQDFRRAAEKNPKEYGAVLPEVAGYTYSERDQEEYMRAYVRSSNRNIESEVNLLDRSLLTIKGKKFPDSLPVLMMIASANIERTPAWETGHRNQLNIKSANHEMQILDGDHYIWYTNLSGVVKSIKEWKTKFQF